MATQKNENIAKGIIDTQTIADAGKLNDKQFSTFFNWVQEESTWTRWSHIFNFREENAVYETLDVPGRVAYPAQEGVDPAIRRGASTGRIVLTPREVIVPVEITDDLKENNLEGTTFADKVMRMFAARLGNNLEQLLLYGNRVTPPGIIEADYKSVGSTSKYVKDGFLELATGVQSLAETGHVVDVEGAQISLNTFLKATRALPTKYRGNKNNLVALLSPDLWSMYQEHIASRGTALGDAVAGGMEHKPAGLPVIPVPLYPLNPPYCEHVTLTGTDTISLKSTNIGSVAVLPSTLDKTPTDPYAETTDYVIDYTNGTITRVNGGGIGSGEVVKVMYDSAPKMILTTRNNLLVGIGRSVRLERDRNIFTRSDQYVMTAKIAIEVLNKDSLVLVKNIGEITE